MTLKDITAASLTRWLAILAVFEEKSKESAMSTSDARKRSFQSVLTVIAWFVAASFSHSATAQGSHYVPLPTFKQAMIQGPGCLAYAEPWEPPSVCDDATHRSWLSDVQHWRIERRERIGYSDSRYTDPRMAWTQSAFMQSQAMVEDRYLYDPVARRYTVDRYLDDLKARFGGVDAVLIWPTYPNIGIDDRNQIDLLRSMPGGIEGVKRLVADFHRRGVRVLFPFMLWDRGTNEPGVAWSKALVDVMSEVGADGMNGDTQQGVPLAFSLAADATGHPLAFQPELPPADEALAWNMMTWGQYEFGFVPKVDRYRWLETRHMVNISDRWNRSKVDDLQYAFFNGEGWESWENIWGIWNGVTPRDGEATRRVATIERGVASFLTSADWEPFYPTNQFGIFASRWPKGDQTVWTIVNRNEYDVDGAQLSVKTGDEVRWFDLYHGVELKPALEHGRFVLSFPIEAKGYGAVLAVHGEPDAATRALLVAMKAMTARPLISFDATWRPLNQKIVTIAPTSPYTVPREGMVEIPAAEYDFKVRGVEIEGSDQVGVDVAYPWDREPRRFHQHVVSIRRFFIDRTPVTNRQYKLFIEASHYRPADDGSFLKDWKGGNFPEGWAEKPVTWVSVEDARAYCSWAGRRLPHEWEWQYAAQGTDNRIYPWGNDWREDAVPTVDRSAKRIPPADVSAHPIGASPFGVLDLVGNIWQWTDEYQDEHTRAAILRGGSSFQPQGSIWYFPQAYRNDQHGKLLLMAPSRDRSGAIGFRCAADAQ
jgi:formylglycine-generating enzyme required for sulfatase activity